MPRTASGSGTRSSATRRQPGSRLVSTAAAAQRRLACWAMSLTRCGRRCWRPRDATGKRRQCTSSWRPRHWIVAADRTPRASSTTPEPSRSAAGGQVLALLHAARKNEAADVAARLLRDLRASGEDTRRLAFLTRYALALED